MTFSDVTTGSTILASDLNQLIDWANHLNGDTGAVVLNGGTSGTATCYQTVRGTFKYTYIQLNAFKTAGSTQQITLPTPYTTCAYVRTTDTEAMSLKSGGSDQTVQVVNGWPASAGNAGAVDSGGVFKGYNFVECRSGFNQVNFGASWSGAHSGCIIIEGI